MKHSVRPGEGQPVKVVEDGEGGASGCGTPQRGTIEHAAQAPDRPSGSGWCTGRRRRVGAMPALVPRPRVVNPARCSASRQARCWECRSGTARPDHAVDRAIALDDDIRCVGCRAATGVVIDHVGREALSGAEPGRSVRVQAVCHVWFLERNSPGGCAGGATNLTGGRSDRARNAWPCEGGADDDRRSLREGARS
jgi:hypothetical protein